MPRIFTLHCKGAGYVVPSKELKVADVSCHLHVFIVHTPNISFNLSHLAHTRNISILVQLQFIQVLKISKRIHQYIVGNLLPGQFYCVYPFQ